MRHLTRLLAMTVVLAAACGGDSDDRAEHDVAKPAPAASTANAVALTGRIIEVRMITNEKGNFFEPSSIEAKPGDVLRFKLVQGVHNAYFLPDSNPGRTNLPEATPYAQLPGQTFDVPLTFGTGKFFFQCIPHAALGMIGHVEVED